MAELAVNHRFLSPGKGQRTSAAVADLFDMQMRAKRRDRAARLGPELFLHGRAFEDCLERIALLDRYFDRALLIGCPDPSWPERLRPISKQVDVRDPGRLFARKAQGEAITEDAWMPREAAHDLVLAIGTLDSVNDLPLALRLIRHTLVGGGLFIGALPGGETLPQLRTAMRAADIAIGAAAPHVHPRIEPAALAPLLGDAGFVHPVVDVDRAKVSYPSLSRLVADLRAMAGTNVLSARPRFIGREARAAALRSFASAGDGERTTEIFETIHFAAWTGEES
jgi:NADH dehydrogenase [ubiquinone] 1 alpha subcomplex assembly factor 5